MDTNEALKQAFIYFQEGNLQQAEHICREILKVRPDIAEVYCNLGLILNQKNEIDEAITCYQKALQCNPNLFEAYKNLGIILQIKGHFDEAMNCYQSALQVNPDDADISFNLGIILNEATKLGNSYIEKGRFAEAANCYEKAMLIIHPANFIPLGGFCYSLFFAGNLRKALTECQRRWQGECSLRYKHLLRPLWDGSDIKGLTILIQSGGFGDKFWFIRYIPLLAQCGAKVIFECQKELLSLLQNYEGIQQIVLSDEPLTGLDYDVHLPIYMLPLAFNTTLENIPSKVPYITVDPQLVQKWANKVNNDNSKLKIGLVWSSTAQMKSYSLELLSPLAQFDEVTFYSLQKGAGAEQAKNPHKGMRLVDLTEEINDFSDTAAFIENLDLVISVDTAVAHLAGALGKPVWVLANYNLFFLYFSIGQNSPWYPTMRCFQYAGAKWEEVIAKIKDELQKKIIERES